MFTEPGEFYKYLQGLIGRHENDLSIILKDLAISTPPTPERLIYAHDKFPVRFTQLLAELPEDFMSFTADLQGITNTTKALAEQPKQSVWSKIFNAGKNIISKVQATKAAISGPQAGGGNPPPPEEPKMTTKKMLIIGGVIVFILIVTFIIIKKYKS